MYNQPNLPIPIDYNTVGTYTCVGCNIKLSEFADRHDDA